MFIEQYRQAIVYGVGNKLTLSARSDAVSYGGGGYVDPNLVVLFFLLLFCLLYALILAFDTVSDADQSASDEQPE
jgi:hypothetical protein